MGTWTEPALLRDFVHFRKIESYLFFGKVNQTETAKARGVDDEVKVLIAHGADKVEGLLSAAELGAGDDLIEGLELWPALTVLLMFLDDAALRVTVERDETAVVFEDKLVGEQYTNGGLAASAFLVGGYDNLVALLRGSLPDVEKWYVHKVGYR